MSALLSIMKLDKLDVLLKHVCIQMSFSSIKCLKTIFFHCNTCFHLFHNFKKFDQPTTIIGKYIQFVTHIVNMVWPHRFLDGWHECIMQKNSIMWSGYIMTCGPWWQQKNLFHDFIFVIGFIWLPTSISSPCSSIVIDLEGKTNVFGSSTT